MHTIDLLFLTLVYILLVGVILAVVQLLVAGRRPIPPLTAWEAVVLDALVVAHIYRREHDTDPRRALKDLIDFHVDVALDPDVSERARALLDTPPPTHERESADSPF
jgi:hypothetical protein